MLLSVAGLYQAAQVVTIAFDAPVQEGSEPGVHSDKEGIKRIPAYPVELLAAPVFGTYLWA